MSEPLSKNEILDNGADTDDFDLGRYLDIIRKRKWVILATIAVGVTATVLYTLRQTKIYEATASVVVEPQAPQVFGQELQEVVQLGTGNYWSNQEYYNTQLEILQSYDLAKETVRRHHLYEDPRVVPQSGEKPLSKDKRIARATAVLHGSVHAKLAKESRIVRVSVTSPDPALAADLANKHVETFIANNLEVRTEGTDDAAKFLATELDRAEAALKKSEQELSDFKQENNILSVSLDEKVNILAADIKRYTSALSDAKINRLKLDSVRTRAREAMNTDNVLESPIFALAESPTVNPLKTQYVQERKKLVELSETLGPKNPAYVAQKKKVDDLYAAIEREAKLAMQEIEERYQAALSAENKFRSELKRLKDEAFALGPKKIAYNRLERQQESDTENYKVVLDRLRASNLSSRNQIGNIRPHDEARVPSVPVYPRMRLNVALAIVASLLLGLLLAFVLDYLDRTIKSAEDVEHAVRLPTLGLIPVVNELSSGNTPEILSQRDLYVFRQPTSAAAECCRSIRTNILFSAADRPLNVLTVSSPNPREGKTTSVIYLGTTMAQSDQRVLLVDTDMRRPRIHKSMGVARNLGLSNLILGEAGYDDAIKTTEVPNLYVLPCGPTPPNPAELLLTNRFREILGELRSRFDRIILDSPPLQAVTDAVVLGRQSDGVIVVTQAGKTTRDDLARSVRQLQDVDAHLVGVVLNDLDLSDRRYGYYYYAYGYGETRTKEAESSHA